MFIEEHGRGPAVLLLHGVVEHTRSFRPLVEALEGSRRVLIAELPGYGRSAPFAEPYDFVRVNALLEDELLARDVRECEVVGHSAGVYRALLLALGTRVRVNALVSLGGLAGVDAPVRDAFEGMAKQLRGGLQLGPIALDLLTAPGFAERSPESARDVLASIAGASMEVAASEYEGLARAPDLRPRLGELACAVTARVGALDKATPVAWSEALVRGVSKGTLQIVEGAAHCLLQEDREATVAAILAALG